MNSPDAKWFIPQPSHTLKNNEIFTADYYVALNNVTAAPGIRADGSVYPAYTPNHLGARVRMPHLKLRLDKWRYHLLGYEDAELVQFGTITGTLIVGDGI